MFNLKFTLSEVGHMVFGLLLDQEQIYNCFQFVIHFFVETFDIVLKTHASEIKDIVGTDRLIKVVIFIYLLQIVLYVPDVYIIIILFINHKHMMRNIRLGRFI